MILKIRALIFTLIFLAATSCRTDHVQKSPESPIGSELVTTAEHLSIEDHDSYSKVIIKNPWQGGPGIQNEYYLFPAGATIPNGIDSTSVIFVPLKSVVCMSVTHAAMISVLDRDDVISAVSGSNFYYSPAISKKISSGLIKDVGYENTLDNEMIVSLGPDLVIMYGIGGESEAYAGKLREMGIRVLFNADYLETDPLGKAEWIKLFGSLLDCRQKADSIFLQEVSKYNQIKGELRKKAGDKPEVLLGLPFKDTWYISPGNSYISKLIADAGGNYLWSDIESDISMPYGLEGVYTRAVKAKFWLNTGTARSKDEIAAMDKRFTQLPCFISGEMYNNDRRMTQNGGNDYWESGAVFPHFILEDMAEIFHPGILGNHDLYFYRKLQ